MTRDEIIETALQCGVWIPMQQGQERELTIDRLQCLVGRAIAAEREACARLCEAIHENGTRKYTHADECAAAIRVGGEQ